MIDLDTEELILISDVASAVPWLPRRRGRKLHTSALYRWCRVGVTTGDKKQKLEAVRTPSGLATSEAALQRFFAGLNGTQGQPIVQARKSEARRLAAVNAKLDQMLGDPRGKEGHP